MTATVFCLGRRGNIKARFASVRAARRSLAHSWKYRSCRWPSIYRCPGCHRCHMTQGGVR